MRLHADDLALWLKAKPTTLKSLSADVLQCWLVPRLGTHSAWSAKVADMVERCHFQGIRQVEKGIHIQVEGITLPQLEQWLQQEHLYDPLTQSLIDNKEALPIIFQMVDDVPHQVLDMTAGISDYQRISKDLGLSLSEKDCEHLRLIFENLRRSPTAAELMMYAQVNSEHCRHKLFNSQLQIDSERSDKSLFAMIRSTHKNHPGRTLVAYSDNATIISRPQLSRWLVDIHDTQYRFVTEDPAVVFKVETHNHSTAFSPFQGGATGAGGEIRDESAAGRGATPLMGLSGIMVSDVASQYHEMPWIQSSPRAHHIQPPEEIIRLAPAGAATYNNEFGRPACVGFYRSFSAWDAHAQQWWGYHKPVMLAGGVGRIRPQSIRKRQIPVGAQVIVIGGPAVGAGVGGGVQSSSCEQVLEFKRQQVSVQNVNPQVQRRAQEVINQCMALGEKNPILSIHDVGAGGLSNAIPELIAGSGRGVKIDCRAIPMAEKGLSPMAIWCNESQERYVIACGVEGLNALEVLCQRERCPIALIGEVTAATSCVLQDTESKAQPPVDWPMTALFSTPDEQHVEDSRRERYYPDFDTNNIDLGEAIERVIQHPTVANKSFLVNVGDRSVGGLITRDQCVGPWQVPVSDVAVSAAGFYSQHGEALAIGERSPVAVLDPVAAAGLALGEVITNIMAADVAQLSDITLSANWMAAISQAGQVADCYDAVKQLTEVWCADLGVCIPVGKDSLSMHVEWQEDDRRFSVTSPSTCVISATALVADCERTLTPQLQPCSGASALWLFDLSDGKPGLGATILAQVYNHLGGQPASLDSVGRLKQLFECMRACRAAGIILAYHDRSDGGLLATLAEMMFAGHIGIDCQLDSLGNDVINSLFNESLGVVIQVAAGHEETLKKIIATHGLTDLAYQIGTTNTHDKLRLYHRGYCTYQRDRVTLGRLWSTHAYAIKRERDHTDCAKAEFDCWLDRDDPGLSCHLTFEHAFADREMFVAQKTDRPVAAILREQGTNGHREMAAALSYVGFDVVDVPMSDLETGRFDLAHCHMLALCGGFSYGDALGAGRGWAQVVLHEPKLRAQFEAFFARPETLTLGVCNGCQTLSAMREIIPGTEHWPHFVRNRSAQFEARVSLLKVADSTSVLFRGMANSVIPCVISHGEGRATFYSHEADAEFSVAEQAVAHYVDGGYIRTSRYPHNPNGSVQAIVGACSLDGRITAMMPHPERCFLRRQMSWHPEGFPEASPWTMLFLNARRWFNDKKYLC